jgi:hypothetical protein
MILKSENFSLVIFDLLFGTRLPNNDVKKYGAQLMATEAL